MQTNGQSREDPADGSQSIPQGDSFSPVGLNALLLAAVLQLEFSLEQGETMVTILDDRNAVVKKASRMETMINHWTHRCDILGLKENI